jgi:hypothetical protein
MPKGSGYFAASIGLVFLVVLAVSFFEDLKNLPPDWLLRIWLLFAGVILVGWGANRIKNGRPSWVIGQETLNFVVAVVGATIAIFALLK